jgi:hypothetical protein
MTKKMKMNYLKIAGMVMIALLVGFTSCKKDETKQLPTVTAPATTEVQKDLAVDITFNYTADGGFSAASVTATGGTAVIKTNGTSGATAGTIVVTFTAGSTIGAGSVTLVVSDNEGQSGRANAVINIVEEQIIFYVSGNITADETWKTGKVYVLQSRISVVAGVTLTIEPGVVVKGQAGTGANATCLLIARGGTLMAEGTATSPIIFTSVADEIMPGEIASPNLDPDINGLWGGLLVLGYAPISADAPTQQIEGIPPSDPNGQYGGTDETDNSGVIRYISIRHGGTNIGEGNEINGLTLGGVGSGTVIEYVEVVANQDDGIEWFGGKVNVSNAILWNVGDDAVDTDQSWGGTLDNFVVINPFDECFEIDGPEGTMEDINHVMNGTAKAEGAQGLVDLDDNSLIEMNNVYFFDLELGQDVDLNPVGLTAANWQCTLPADTNTVDEFFKHGTDAWTTVVAAGANTVGADLTPLKSWSWSGVSGALDF